MANFAGGMAKGFAKGAIFNAAMAGLSHLANSGQQGDGNTGPNAAKVVSNEQGTADTDGHIGNSGDKLPSSGGGGSSELSAEQRHKVFETAKTELGAAGLIDGSDNIKYVDKFAVAKPNAQGFLIPENTRLFDNEDNMFDFLGSDKGDGYKELNGRNSLGSSSVPIKDSVVFANATTSGLKGMQGISGYYNMDSGTSVKWTILHEQAHGIGIRLEHQANQYAIDKLGLKCSRACP